MLRAVYMGGIHGRGECAVRDGMSGIKPSYTSNKVKANAPK
jgi:hypothetical protein